MFTFKKTERLCTKKDIESLYSAGKHKTFPPLKIYWKKTVFEGPVRARVVISVPKRIFKRAVDRNLIKRQIREVYRLNKNKLTDTFSEKQVQADLLVLFVGSKHPEITELETALLKAFTVVTKDLNKE